MQLNEQQMSIVEHLYENGPEKADNFNGQQMTIVDQLIEMKVVVFCVSEFVLADIGWDIYESAKGIEPDYSSQCG